MRKLFFLMALVVLGQSSLTAQIKDNLEDFDYKKVKKNKADLPDYYESILKNGFFIDGMIQFTSITISDKSFPASNFQQQGLGLGFRLGSKWYFGEMRNYRPGLSAIWGRTHVLLAESPFNSSISPYITFAPLNIGFVNAFSFGGELGFEINLNFGFNLILDIHQYDRSLGYIINPTIKFRYRSLAVGLDITIMAGDYLDSNIQNFNTLVGLTIGGKF